MADQNEQARDPLAELASIIDKDRIKTLIDEFVKKLPDMVIEGQKKNATADAAEAADADASRIGWFRVEPAENADLGCIDCEDGIKDAVADLHYHYTANAVKHTETEEGFTNCCECMKCEPNNVWCEALCAEHLRTSIEWCIAHLDPAPPHSDSEPRTRVGRALAAGVALEK